MNEERLRNLENETETYLKNFTEDVTSNLEQINKILDREYEKEINDQINFLKTITGIAGVVAPFSLVLLSVQLISVHKFFLLLGFILLLVTILVTLIFSKKLTLDKRYKDTSSLTVDYIIAKGSVEHFFDENKSVSDRVDISINILENFNNIIDKISNLGYTSKLIDLRTKLSVSNQWSIFLFSLGLTSIIVSVVHSYLVNSLASLIILVCN